MRIDAHQHFWHYDPQQHVWMTDRMDVLRRDYLPSDLAPLLKQVAFDGTIAVQARQMLEETEWLLKLAHEHEFIKGVVGWVDLRSPDVARQIEMYSRSPKLVGVRHVVHDEPDDRFMRREDFRRGIGQLQGTGLVYDLLLFPRHLPVAVELVEEFPDQVFVLDHIAKPAIKERRISGWKEDLKILARHPGVYCKLSGMVTEAEWKGWKADEFKPYLDVVFDAFGAERLMIGSDWPVCTLSGDYAATMKLVIDHVAQFPPPVRNNILGATCARVYGVDSEERHQR